MFEVFNSQNPQIVNEIFCIRNEASHELWQKSRFYIPSVIIISSGIGSIQFLGSNIWELIPHDIKCFENLRGFKTAIKK